jgi:alpha-1,3-rhamnosyl/mannosyltransferase
VICGEGSHGPRLRARAEALGLDVRFLGHLSPDELRGAYSACACFVHAGAIETFGLSVLEAMACACAVVAARGGAVPEVVGEAGLLAPSEDAAAFAALVRSVLADETKRAALGQAAHRRATERFSADAMQAAYAAAIAAACGVGP